jgi:hypothetical protein
MRPSIGSPSSFLTINNYINKPIHPYPPNKSSKSQTCPDSWIRPRTPSAATRPPRASPTSRSTAVRTHLLFHFTIPVLTINIEVDNATDKAGLGDKYDKKISDGINKQTNDQIFHKK